MGCVCVKINEKKNKKTNQIEKRRIIKERPNRKAHREREAERNARKTWNNGGQAGNRGLKGGGRGFPEGDTSPTPPAEHRVSLRRDPCREGAFGANQLELPPWGCSDFTWGSQMSHSGAKTLRPQAPTPPQGTLSVQRQESCAAGRVGGTLVFLGL